MRILRIHNKYKIRGGEDECCLAEQTLLKSMGHQVDLYEEDNNSIDNFNRGQIAIKTIWSQESYQIVENKLKKQKYDVVHIDNFFPLISPAVYYAIKKAGVPVIQTIHNYRFLCSNGLFFKNQQVCEQCINKFIPYPGVLRGCYRESSVASAGVAAMLIAHRLIKTWSKQVDLFICLTEFAKRKMIEGGLPADKIVVKPNFVNPDPQLGSHSGNYAIYVGRLSVEKGLDTLLAAWKLLNNELSLKIVGDGPLADQVLAATKKYPQIEWLGRKPIKEVYELIGEAKFLIFPSKWYETFGRVAVEAFAKGTPVISSDLGAPGEIVDDGRTGFHFQAGDEKDLMLKIDCLVNNPDILLSMSKEARAEFEAKYTAPTNYQKLMDIYHSQLN